MVSPGVSDEPGVEMQRSKQFSFIFYSPEEQDFVSFSLSPSFPSVLDM